MIHRPFPRLCQCGVVHRSPVLSARQLRPFDGLYWSADAKNRMLDAMDESQATGMAFGSLHTAFSTTGANEVPTTGSPAYQRRALSWAAASGGVKALANVPDWDVPGGSTVVAWVGFWDLIAAGVFKGMIPAGGGPLRPCSVETSGDLSANTINAKAHGFLANTRAVFWGTLPAGLLVGTLYWVLAAGLTSDIFEVSLDSPAGSQTVVDLTGTQPYSFFAQQAVPQTFTGQGHYSLSSASLDLSAVA